MLFGQIHVQDQPLQVCLRKSFPNFPTDN
uniref:Uncharacterized protein n=1 Tax=Arundo donax TaxID=35708 RepID=A0A0A9BSA7_ARUDO